MIAVSNRGEQVIAKAYGMNGNANNTLKIFDQKVWRAIGMIAVTFILLWIFKYTIGVLLLILTATLVALFFQRLAGIIQRKSGWKKSICLFISVLGSLLLLVLTFWFIGARVQGQIAELSEALPASIESAKAKIDQNPIGARLLQGAGNSGDLLKKYGPAAQRFFTTSFGVLGDIYAILFLGIFFTISPKTYINGIVKLFPAKARSGAKHVLDETGNTLAQWLKGQLFAMLVVAVLTWIGLSIIGVPMALALALIAGLFNFVPNIGPLVAMVPAVLVSMMEGGNTALLTVGLYLLVQGLESNLITPVIQKKMIEIPPALILIGQLLIGTLLGVMGIILATPIVAILMVLVKELYIKKQDGPIIQ